MANEFNSNKLLKTFFEKYESGVERNRVKFREISKIARGELVGIDKAKIVKTLRKYITNHAYTIDQAYEDSVAEAYTDRNVERKLTDVIAVLDNLKLSDITTEIRGLLRELKSKLNRLI